MSRVRPGVMLETVSLRGSYDPAGRTPISSTRATLPYPRVQLALHHQAPELGSDSRKIISIIVRPIRNGPYNDYSMASSVSAYLDWMTATSSYDPWLRLDANHGKFRVVPKDHSGYEGYASPSAPHTARAGSYDSIYSLGRRKPIFLL